MAVREREETLCVCEGRFLWFIFLNSLRETLQKIRDEGARLAQWYRNSLVMNRTQVRFLERACIVVFV
jgi:hypothetical protein